jgi:hypothetical protein
VTLVNHASHVTCMIVVAIRSVRGYTRKYEYLGLSVSLRIVTPSPSSGSLPSRKLINCFPHIL